MKREKGVLSEGVYLLGLTEVSLKLGCSDLSLIRLHRYKDIDQGITYS